MREMNGTECGSHFLDESADSSLQTQADEVIVDCLDVRVDGEVNSPTMGLNEVSPSHILLISFERLLRACVFHVKYVMLSLEIDS